MRFSSLETSYEKFKSRKIPKKQFKTHVTIANWVRATFTPFDTIGMTWTALDTNRENSATGHKAIIYFVEFTSINAFFVVFVTITSTSSPKIIISEICSQNCNFESIQLYFFKRSTFFNGGLVNELAFWTPQYCVE